MTGTITVTIPRPDAWKLDWQETPIVVLRYTPNRAGHAFKAAMAIMDANKTRSTAYHWLGAEAEG